MRVSCRFIGRIPCRVFWPNILGDALDDRPDQDLSGTLPRCGVWECEAVGDGCHAAPHCAFVTASISVAGSGRILHGGGGCGDRIDTSTSRPGIAGDAAFALFEATSGNVAERVRDAQLAKAFAELGALKPALDRLCRSTGDRARKRPQTRPTGPGIESRRTGRAVIPVDVIGLYVLMPRL